MITNLEVSNFLSFGTEGISLSLGPLNICVGTNGAGKSNLLHALRFLQVIPPSNSPIFSNPEPNDFLWQGSNQKTFRIGVKVSKDKEKAEFSLVSSIAAHNFIFIKENLIVANEDSEAYLTVKRDGGECELSLVNSGISSRAVLKVAPLNSILNAPELIHYRSWFDEYRRSFRFFDQLYTGLKSQLRDAQSLNSDTAYLLSSGENLVLLLNHLEENESVIERITDKLQLFYPSAKKISVRIEKGQIVLRLHERGLNRTIPMSRLSDGTLRFLCLLVVLCHPTPPPLICIEEPELGMHPDIIPTIAELLIEASQRTQLIVTTHSSMLVSAIGEYDPEAVVVCERDDDGTQMRRLNKEQLAPWLERYSLGDLWMKGEIGGTRW